MREIDTFSFQLGMINCFVEMVACGVKRLAISPPLTPEEFSAIEDASDKIASEFGASAYLDKALLLTDLQSEDFTKGKWAILYFKDDCTLDAYHELKARKHRLENVGAYDEGERKALSRDFMRLLSYPENVIEAKLSQDEPTDPYIHKQSGKDS